jgi:hypothetical protein
MQCLSNDEPIAWASKHRKSFSNGARHVITPKHAPLALATNKSPLAR